MKWHRLYIIMIFISMFFLQGCKQVDLSVEEKITAPEVKELPVQGTWKVESYIGLDNTVSSKDKVNYLGETAAFDKSIAVLGTESCNSPEYKIKSVSAEEYFLYRYKVNAVKLGIKEEQVNVVTVSSNQQPFHDFIKINDSSMLVYENNGFLYMSKVSDKVSASIPQNIANSDTGIDGASSIKQDSLMRTGVFLGLRTSGSVNDTSSSYRTLWIASQNRKIRPVYEMKQLFVPRKKGFWEIDYWSQKSASKLKGTLYAHSVVDEDSNYTTDNNNLLEEGGRRDILFVGNDYIGTEYRYIDSVSLKERAKYQVLPIDNIRSGIGINISDIAGRDGLKALNSSSQAYIMSLDKSKADLLEKNAAGDNFSLSRRNGQWIVTGRLDYLIPVEEKTFEDFNIYLMPPQKLINYNDLKLPWNYIKEKIPEAMDVYTSPNKDLAIIKTRDSIEVYNIENGKLSEKPAESISLQKDESIVMAEWAVGDYMQKWEKVIKPRATVIESNSKN